MMNQIKPMMKVTNKVLNKTDGQPAEVGTNLYMYGDIGENWWSEGITALRVRATLSRIDDDVVNLHIHSNGGDAFEGIAIYNVLKQSDKTINVYIDGLAASAASIIALAGDKIYMPRNTQMMIHNAASGIWHGFAEDFEKMASALRNVNDSVRQTYLGRFTGTEEELIRYMDNETFFTADQAVALNLADEILNYDAEPAEADDEEDETETGETEPPEVPEKEDDEEETPVPENANFARFAAFANSITKLTRKED